MSVYGVTWKKANKQHLTDYVTYLLDTTSYSPATLKSRVSGISYFYKIKLNVNLADSYATDILLKSMDKSMAREKLLPITHNVLTDLLRVVYAYKSRYMSHMFYIMYKIMYFLALRISELLHYSGKFNHAFTRSDLVLEGHKLRLKVRSGKHNSTPMDYELDCNNRFYWHLTQYLRLRGDHKGPLFCYKDKTPVKRSFFINQLQEDLSSLGLDYHKYNCHSFRVGRTSDLALEGASDRQIALIGRWRSDAFREYVRPTSITL